MFRPTGLAGLLTLVLFTKRVVAAPAPQGDGTVCFRLTPLPRQPSWMSCRSLGTVVEALELIPRTPTSNADPSMFRWTTTTLLLGRRASR